ncbi:acid protease [Rickenella mellea]|uniref:Acid protease n=1 Tax=Rickenella mellea TaxID=50990 RepID=A0A4Y7QG71_9AGAM|nr:acid protease [Rickenella mellea]
MKGCAMRLILVSCVVFLSLTSTYSLDEELTAELGIPTVPLRSDVPTLDLLKADRTESLVRRATGIGEVSLNTNDQTYYSLITVGGIAFRVALDTASSDLWLLASSCTSAVCKSVPTYPLSYSSPSFVSVNNNATTFNVSFADTTGSSGFLARESVRLLNFTVEDQVFGLVDSSNVTLKNQVSGILGFGFPRLSTLSPLTTNSTPFINALAQTGQLDYPLFGLSLTHNDTGSLSLGAIDASVVHNASNIEWNKVVPFSPFGLESNTSRYLQWAIRLSQIMVNATQVTPQPTYPDITESSLALFDVGTNGIFGPYQDVARIFDLIPTSRLVDADAGVWAVPCDTAETMIFIFGRQNFTLQPTDFLIGPAAGNPNLCLSWPQATPPSSDGIDWQFGTPFLRTVYSIFSYGINKKEPPMIGLYALHNDTTLTDTPASVSSYFAVNSATIATTLPNFPLSTPSLTAPTYAFNTSVPASVGQLVQADLGTSTYSPILAPTANASEIPTVSPSPTLTTVVLTSSGIVITTTSHAGTPSVRLGVPPGASSGISLKIPTLHAYAVATSLMAISAGMMLIW